ncbi:DddA-like double-stranded DNA deaminase toxin [Saccharothrix mutabilis subsp. capreolus]|uniref:DddA-like double-stranded DNA deaminase toxin n=1 Tax=Saccharothrix mutabilis TaxID=33921 RepID=UPI0035EB1B96
MSSGQKTHGRWIRPDGTVEPMVSGRDADADSADEQLEKLDMPGRAARAADVEMKLAARMVREGIRHATVVINYTPCRGRFGCDTLVPILLPEGFTLTVHGVTPEGQPFRKRYTGGARPWWR